MNTIDQSDLHPDLPKHLKNQLLSIKIKIHHIEKLVRRHHSLSRRGQYWYNKAKRLDKRYRQIWYLNPYPEKIEVFNMVGIHTTLSVDIQKMPQSGFVKRLRLPRKEPHRPVISTPTEFFALFGCTDAAALKDTLLARFNANPALTVIDNGDMVDLYDVTPKQSLTFTLPTTGEFVTNKLAWALRTNFASVQARIADANLTGPFPRCGAAKTWVRSDG